ncbi:MAG: hypothetical protein HYU67_05585 [Flavobacteriia bacterium]|nr:hypothetical protein [Flavobacteriia bacterium]
MLSQFISLCFFISLYFVSFSQERVWLFGKVKDTLQAQNFYNIMIINRNNGRGVFGLPDGSFSLYVNNNDSITISVKGYPVHSFRVTADSNHQMKKILILENKVYEKPEVIVKPIKSLEQIKEERAGLTMRETRMVTGLEVMRSPITALYQHFSKKEQNKKWIAEMEFKNSQTKILKELLRLYVSYDIVDLNEEEFEQFITFLNIDDTFLKTSTDLELVMFIKDKFEHFKTIK